MFAGPGALHVFPEQGLSQDHLPQLAAWLQRGPDHVLLAGGTGAGRAGCTLDNLMQTPQRDGLWAAILSDYGPKRNAKGAHA